MSKNMFVISNNDTVVNLKMTINIFMFALNLPHPSDELLDSIRIDLASTLDTHVPQNTFQPGMVDFIYFHGKSKELGIKEYSKFFEEDFNFTGMLFRPDSSVKESNLLPHPDLGRITGLNYILSSGGDNVTTTWYNKVNENLQNREWMHDIYEGLEPIRSYCYKEHVWYAMESCRFHSVENVQSDRLILTVSFTNLKFNDFLLKYRHLIDSIV